MIEEGAQVEVMSRWEQRFRAPVAMWSRLASKAPERGVVGTNPGGVYQLHAWEVPTGELRPVTDAPQGVLTGTISPDGRHIYYHSDREGNELGHWVRVPFEGGEVESLTPDMPPYPSFTMGISGQSDRIGLCAATPEGMVVFLVDDADGRLSAPREIFRSTGITFGPLLSEDGRLAGIMTTERSTGGLEFNLVAVDATTGERVAELWDGEGTSVEYFKFAPGAGDERILATSNRSGMKRPLLWNPRSGERVELALEELEGEIEPLDWSSDGRHILLGQIHHAVQRLWIYDLQQGTSRSVDGPPGTFGWAFAMVAYFGPGGEIYAHWQDATHPEDLISIDPSEGSWRTVLPAGEVPASRPWRSIFFRSGDGQEIQGWLCVPEGDGPFPTILHTHGGPTAATMEVFDADCQAFVDQGFAYCAINYRGSTTFGRDFQEQIIGNPGQLEVMDMVAAREWLVSNKVARPDQILLAGRSYGGYLTLQALGLHPELWAGGMAGVPVTDWKMLYEDAAGTLRAFAGALLKGTPQDRPEPYAAGSPLTYVDRVTAPVLILYGQNDTRCPARPVEEYIRRMQELGKTVEVYQFEGGHLGAYTDAEEAIREQRVMLDFASRVVNGDGSRAT